MADHPRRFAFKRAMAALLSALLIVATAPAAQSEDQSGPIVIGATPTGILVWLAHDLGLFEQEGVSVQVREYQSGTLTLPALIAGEVNLSTNSEFSFVSNSFVHPDLRVLTTLSASRTTLIFGRRDKGVSVAADLRGKRIGVTRKSTGLYVLGVYLAIQGIGLDEVELVDLNPSEIVEAIDRGVVDAAITWEPFVYQARDRLGGRLAVLPDQDSQFFHFLLSGRRDWIATHRTELVKVMQALHRAEDYALHRPERAKHLFAQRFSLSEDFVEYLWPKHSLRIGLQQGLIGIMEEEAAWRMRSGLVEATTSPDFLTMFAPEFLQATKPSSVRLIP